MSRKNVEMEKNVQAIEKKVAEIEKYIVEKNSTDVFENMQFLIGMMKEFDNSLGKTVNQLRMMQGEFQFYNMFLQERKIIEEFQAWRKRKIEEMKPKPKSEIEQKLDDQKKKLEELENGN